MGTITVSDSKDYFIKEGKPYFYLADTVWSVFSNATEEEWEEYLDYRRSQRFNALQISVLPIIHDASDTVVGVPPFAVNDAGGWNFYEPQPEFFAKAERMLEAAVSKGFVPALVILWNDFVPGTWANKFVDQAKYTMPYDAVKPYTEYVVRRFAKFNPVYFISGDTVFEDETVIDYYALVLDTVKELAPDALTALHPASNFHRLPDRLMESPNLDFYIYQSGHNLEDQYNTYELAQAFLAKPVRRPVLNSEPCYEGHGHGNRFGRFGAFDLRRAFWSSVLAGAKAGFTYGAHGIWSWHRRGARFTNENWSKLPLDWKTALRLEGAWDVGYAAWLFGQYGMHRLNPAQQLLASPFADIRVGAAEDRSLLAVYTPYSNDVRLTADLTGYDVTVIELEGGRIIRPDITVSGGESKVHMVEFNSDVLLVAVKN